METEPVLENLPEPKSHLLPLIIALVVVLSGGTYFYLKVSYPFLFTDLTTKMVAFKTSLTPSPTPVPTPSPSTTNILPSAIPYTLPTGSQTYRYSHGDEVKGPKIQNVTFDPLDAPNGTKQTITLEIESVSPMTDNSIIVSTDNRAKTLNLKLTSGDSTKGTYVTSWTVDDTHDKVYAVRYILKSTGDTYDNTMYLR